MGERVFNVDEAEALIPRLEFLVERLQASARALRDGVSAVAAEHDLPVATLSITKVLRLRPGLNALVEELSGFVREIEELGCELKDLELGLVDFPAHIGGERALLCWQYGEKAVGYWHRVDDGFAARKPLRRRAGVPRRYLQ
jgi:hypothetical protein